VSSSSTIIVQIPYNYKITADLKSLTATVKRKKRLHECKDDPPFPPEQSTTTRKKTSIETKTAENNQCSFKCNRHGPLKISAIG
jgi:hypothetical protein